MSTLALIGSAGRGADAQQLTDSHWRMMTCIAQTVACTLGAKSLVSGGSSWADHTAVQLYLDGHADHLTLHLSCPWVAKTCSFDPKAQEGRRLNQLHSAFWKAAGVESLGQIGEAIAKGARTTVSPGFHARNREVAEEAEALLAFTFGQVGTEGGTAYTWREFHALHMAVRKDHARHGHPFPDDVMQQFHFNLTSRVLTRHA